MAVKRPPPTSPDPLPPPRPTPEAWADFLSVRGLSIHEARLVPQHPRRREVLAPKFVRAALTRWEHFVEAFAGGEHLLVAAIVPGSLRVMFASSEQTQMAALEALDRLVKAGDDPEQLAKTAGEGLAGYFDLVKFLANAKCSLELSLPMDDPNEAWVKLPRAVAARQHKALNVSSEATSELQITAQVVSASLSKRTIELEGVGEEMHVTPSSLRFLRGLKIGSEYAFEAKRIERRENPSSAPRIEIEISSASPIVTLALISEPRRLPLAPKGPPLSWWKRLASTDAARSASGQSRPYVPLTGKGHKINTTTWFREKMFDTLDWTIGPTGKRKMGETADVEMSVTFLGVTMDPDTFHLSHDPKRSEMYNNAPATHLHWSPNLLRLLAANDVTNKWLVIERDAYGGFHLSIRDSEPET